MTICIMCLYNEPKNEINYLNICILILVHDHLGDLISPSLKIAMPGPLALELFSRLTDSPLSRVV